MTSADALAGKRIAFRTDASIEIGTGHVMRCLTLADALRAGGAACLFLCRAHDGHLIELIEARGHRVAELPPAASAPSGVGDPAHAAWLGSGWHEDAVATRELLGPAGADWLVVDHYAIDARWERVLRSSVRRVLVMDDLADRPHDCDLLLDPTLGRTQGAYRELVPDHAQLLLGPQHALLRPEFAAARVDSLRRREHPRLRRLLVTMGGVDKDNATGRVLDALDTCFADADIAVTVVMGPHAPWLAQVRHQVAQRRMPTQLLVGVSDMARLMSESDLAIGAAGGTSWERCCLGLPAFTLSLAQNQHEMSQSLEMAGAVIAMTRADDIARTMRRHFDEDCAASLLARMIPAAAAVTSGQGVKILAERMCSL
ncbi:UDP-2,4-diacetamido-2,4,6-trideoxy-beta-L-altropyranose hydrolase [Sphingomonas sp.]|uniref:UDP-2,4-diacetamido-2,4, 6-trideoxy-beta-L-altropyranose hydrolase n=1 Tax=Sphingomonas sp. TaxID=28214 RepID=UPI002C79F3A8|nr:UDP-2,4-diacetamido-2,4,6-trideoxy-beta-L-altropyranose hydrolase [Sphingomonas sp.]HTG37981.1 UDP-2,4-diacetamido-2,4,6-trideoxy-beta-L-altropyranose hydrolase [Sphingomonas sp.]